MIVGDGPAHGGARRARIVSTGRLIDGVWDDQPPAGPANALQVLVSRLRKAVPEAVGESHPAGYRLAIDPDDVDASRFERVCGFGAGETLDLLAALADKSLVVSDGDDRYRMLETIRAYGLEQAGERREVLARHTGYFTELAEAADPHLRASDQLIWSKRLGTDHDNITAALRGAIAAGDAPAALRLVAATGWLPTRVRRP